MKDEPVAEAGRRASALPAKPLRQSTIFPKDVSTLEGSEAGFPACSPALPETRPLTGEARSGSTSTHVRYADATTTGSLTCTQIV